MFNGICKHIFGDCTQERNQMRKRSVPPNLVKQSWNDVQEKQG